MKQFVLTFENPVAGIIAFMCTATDRADAEKRLRAHPEYQDVKLREAEPTK